MKKFQFLSFLASRQFLAFLALIVVALVIWFVGPFFAFGGLKPLAGAGMRVLLIALLLAGVLFWLVGWSISIVFAALLCLLIWYAGPLLSLGHTVPLEPASARFTAIALVVGVFVLFGMFRLWQKMREDDAFLKKVLRLDRKREDSPAAARLRKVEGGVTSALARLKSMRTGARGLGKLFQGKRYLYELPWYITLGSQGSGKTSVLMNGGLAFPVGEQMQRAAGRPAGDAAAVDWWLTNDAVLIDTTGYYTRHRTSMVGGADALAAEPDKTAIDASDKDAANTQASTERSNAGTKQDAARRSNVATASKSSAHTVQSPSVERDSPPEIDRAEWLGFLGILRRNRPRAPINGALLTVDLATLASADEQARISEATALRARLAELRQELGIRFPVYVTITKMDRLAGFAEYFGALTSEGRAQAWGFTLPYGKETVAKEGLRARCHHELTQLVERLTGSIDTHLQDEYDLDKRRKLAALPEEFSALLGPLLDLIDRVFLDSRYDDTQLHSTLRGVYFTSARQQGGEIVAQRHTVVQRLLSAQDSAPVVPARAEGNQGYFLHDLLTRVVFPEAHLVSPNLRWEYRYRLLRLVGHTLALLLFVWLAIGLRVSFGNNSDYLDTIGRKVQALTTRVTSFYKTPKLQAVPDTLTEARNLPTHPGLDLSDPDSAWRYGLYTPAGIAAESRHTYDALEDNLLLPQIVHRLEDVMSGAIANKDPKSAYDALRVYLMLYDKAKFNAGDVKAWVLDDWAKTDSAAAFGGRASMIDHVQQLFSGERVVQSPLIRNDALVQQTRAFLDGSNATDRLYQRAKAAMLKEAPDEFTLLRAVGPQAGTVFTRASDAPLSRGVSGLFTFDGYRNLFDKRLPEFIQIARDDDAWVMGRSYLGEAQKKTAEIVSNAAGTDDALTDAVRREYLMEYAQQWDAFLNDIRTVSGTSLAFNLKVLRSFAAPDSPLARLARAAVRETTLTQQSTASNGSLLQKAADQLNQKTDKALGIRASERVERELVDNRFAALREVVTGNADAQLDPQSATAQSDKTGLDGVANLLNDYYTALTVADNALSNNSMPPASDAAAKLKMAADTMPAPFRATLLKLAADGSREVNQGIGQLLSRQMQAVVGDTCRLTVEGNYPFSPDSKRDVGIDDFTRVFAQGGVIDDFFVKTLAPFVDTSANPWRYRTLPGATEPVQGPSLEPFEHAKAIRDIFFNDPGRKQMTWTADIRIPELAPTIMSLALDIDGQTTRYQHGPVAPFTVTWPGPRGGVHAEITASPRIRPDTSTISTDGPWALMRLLQKGQVIGTATPGRTRVAFSFDGRDAALDIASAGSVANPLTSDVLKTFRCPTSMAMFNLPDSGPPPGLPQGMLPINAGSVSR
ncbi:MULTISPECIES: type VI secretion system membrane subunit TssM [Burkholderia]|uniref:type VI secretion system membrane subunit TssM n=1 Tax=Burkholderia TaxID=32008 RepID=UPI000B7A851A|nr:MULTISPECIES: type VI secretion system membrane subunit TssM [Burkholderia]MBY4724792.1 type VI secretion system membrane subunit TssM [Burkholderia contaminans]MCI3970038.1 type VI secretion system membrane subunit TssM [Burkholderia sp. HI4860]MDN7787541.1 type VI secretion system membrane subunit TssM [Burkholderia contaminans]OXI99201.1 type VI secretion protein VasK [Burkholderia sp. AU33647]